MNTIRKIIGALLVLAGTVLFVAFVFNSIHLYIIGLTNSAIWGFIEGVVPIFALSFLLTGLGVGFIFKKEKSVPVENPNNPLICRYCKQDYDKSWKVCLKCGKPLIEKQNS